MVYGGEVFSGERVKEPRLFLGETRPGIVARGRRCIGLVVAPRGTEDGRESAHGVVEEEKGAMVIDGVRALQMRLTWAYYRVT